MQYYLYATVAYVMNYVVLSYATVVYLRYRVVSISGPRATWRRC